MTVWTALAGAAVLTAAAVVATEAQQSQPFSGPGDYQVYCSSCHGVDGRGDGTIAKSLKKRPADLTLLSRRNNGAFPEEKVFNIIDGRKGNAHADSDMPAWSEVFNKASESAGAESTAARIDTLVKYLVTLQAK